MDIFTKRRKYEIRGCTSFATERPKMAARNQLIAIAKVNSDISRITAGNQSTSSGFQRFLCSCRSGFLLRILQILADQVTKSKRQGKILVRHEATASTARSPKSAVLADL